MLFSMLDFEFMHFVSVLQLISCICKANVVNVMLASAVIMPHLRFDQLLSESITSHGFLIMGESSDTSQFPVI